MSQLSLVFFTVLAQAAACAIAISSCYRLMAGIPADRQPAMLRGNIIFWIIMLVALAISTSHLGQPLRAFNVFRGLGSGSALSWEIMAASLFVAAGALQVLSELRSGSNASLSKAMLIPVIGLGIWLVVAISNVYTLAAVPAWNSSFILIQFMMTAVVLGLTMTMAFAPVSQNNVRLMAGLGLLAMVALWVISPMFQNFIHGLDLPADSLPGHVGSRLALQTVLASIGLLLWVIPALQRKSAKAPAMVGSLVILLGELAGRTLFYDLHIFTG